MTLSGACRCGACRYNLDYDGPPISYACHCLDCQTMTGASFALQVPVLSSRFEITGTLVTWAHPNSKGKITDQQFCAACKTRLYSTNEGRPGIALVRAGTMEDSQAIVPAVHMWTKRKQAWVGLPDGAEMHDEGIPPDRLNAIFARNFA